MKLAHRYNRVILITTVIVMVITGFVYYQTISRILTDKIDDDLVVEEHEVFDYVKLNHRLPQVFNSDDQQISFYPAVKGSVSREFINTDYYNAREHHNESGRGIISAVQVANKYYKILVVESKVETEELIRIIFFITVGVILLLLLILLLINRLLLNRLWKPFYEVMRELKLFSIADKTELQPIQTEIDEFKELNAAVTSMAQRVKHDYGNLKAFTENASHELFTPIAVINSKLDSLIQTENFSPQQSKLLNDLYSAVTRLNRLNRSLLLLVKLENGLEHSRETIDLKALLEEMMRQLEEVYQDKQLTIHYNLADKELQASPYLIDILLNNLLINAIRHNVSGGDISITLNADKLTIANTGHNSALQTGQIFQRFHKSAESEGSGLGLTISRQLCENLGFLLNYEWEAPYHVFSVGF